MAQFASAAAPPMLTPSNPLPATLSERCKQPVSVYYEDTDCVGIVYHSNYLKYFERAREKILGQEALVDLFDSSGRSFVVVKVKVGYKKAARYGDELIVRTIPTIESAYRLEFDQSVWRKNTPKQRSESGTDEEYTLVITGTVQMVCVGGDMKICALPDSIQVEMREVFGDLLNPRKKQARRRMPPPRRVQGSAPPTVAAECEIEIYYEDTDFTGVVYYANYLKFMERARSQLFGFRQLAVMKRDFNASFAVYSAELDYKSGAELGDLIVVKTSLSIESDYRIQFQQNVYRRKAALERIAGSNEGSGNPADDGLLVKGTLVLCCIDDSGKLVKLPQMVMDTVAAKSPSV